MAIAIVGARSYSVQGQYSSFGVCACPLMVFSTTRITTMITMTKTMPSMYIKQVIKETTGGGRSEAARVRSCASVAAWAAAVCLCCWSRAVCGNSWPCNNGPCMWECGFLRPLMIVLPVFVEYPPGRGVSENGF
eukprot:2804913-Lingulodinium_polyedra.AAC.2